MTPCIVWLADSAAHSSSSRYSDSKGRLSKAGPGGRSSGTRSRSVRTRPPTPVLGSSQPRARPSADRIAHSTRAGPGASRDGSIEVNCRTSRGKSPASPRAGSAQTSSTRKSPAISWIRHGRDVWAVSGSRTAEHVADGALVAGRDARPERAGECVLLAHERAEDEGPVLALEVDLAGHPDARARAEEHEVRRAAPHGPAEDAPVRPRRAELQPEGQPGGHEGRAQLERGGAEDR